MRKEVPLSFVGPLILAIHEDRKTHTRRPFNKPLSLDGPRDGLTVAFPFRRAGIDGVCHLRRAPCAVGNILWAKETWRKGDPFNDWCECDYACSNPRHRPAFLYRSDCDAPDEYKWKSAMLMPRKVARTFLEVTAVRIEPANEITDADAIAEGFGSRIQFLESWKKFYPKFAPDHPVLVREFRRLPHYTR